MFEGETDGLTFLFHWSGNPESSTGSFTARSAAATRSIVRLIEPVKLRVDVPLDRVDVASMLVYRGYRYRLYPTPEQDATLRRWEGVLRFLWNLGLEQWYLWMNGAPPAPRWRGERAFLKADGVTQEQAETEPLVFPVWTPEERQHLKLQRRERDHRRYPSAFGQGVELTALRAEHEWIASVPRHVSVSVFVDLETAWKRCFERGGAPHWKRRGDPIGMCEFDGNTFVVGTDHVTFPKLGKIAAVIHRSLGGKQKSITITRDVDHWYASVMCEVEIPDPVPSSKPVVGIDRGVANILADSTGRLVPPDVAHAEKLSAKIKRAQRRLSKKQKGSKNREKAAERLAQLQRKDRNHRAHFLHEQSTYYAKNYGVIVIERLNVKAMTASAAGTAEEPGTNVKAKAGLSRAILSSGWGMFETMLRYKVVPEGGEVRSRDAAYSSQTCSACGSVDAESRPSQAEFHCTSCGHTEHADTNAAKVIHQRGLAITTPKPSAKAPKRKRVSRKKADAPQTS